MMTNLRRINVLGALVGLAAVLALWACSGEGDGSEPENRGDVLSEAAADSHDEESHVAPVMFDQVSALSDGVVSEEEMGSALDAAGECFGEIGADASVVLADVALGPSGGWTVQAGDGSSALVSPGLVACVSATYGDLEMPFLVGSGEDARARAAVVAECLASVGLPIDGQGLEDAASDPASPVAGCVAAGS